MTVNKEAMDIWVEDNTKANVMDTIVADLKSHPEEMNTVVTTSNFNAILPMSIDISHPTMMQLTM